MERKIRWGVIGSGGIARRRTIPEGMVPAANAQLVGVFDRNVRSNQEVAQAFGVPAFASPEELLAAEVDAVYVATPVYAHAQNVSQCLKAGKHVLCEKPLGVSVAETQPLVSLAASQHRQLGVGLMMRFHSQHQEARKIIEEGKLGKPVYSRAQLSCWYPPLPNAWRQNPSQGEADPWRTWVCIASTCWKCSWGLSFRSPATSAAWCTAMARKTALWPRWFLKTAPLELSIRSSAFRTKAARTFWSCTVPPGSILAKGTIGQGSQGEMTFYSRPDGQGYDAQQVRDLGRGIALNPPPVNIYRAEIEEFSQALLDGRESALAGDRGFRSQKILEACYESARTSKSVSVSS